MQRKTRRHTVLSSHHDAESASSHGLRKDKSRTRERGLQKHALPARRRSTAPASASASSSPQSPPEKAGGSNEKDGGKSSSYNARPLESFFSVSSKDPTNYGKSVPSQASDNVSRELDEIEDVIEDDFEDTKVAVPAMEPKKHSELLDGSIRKRSWSLANQVPKGPITGAAGRKFLKTEQTQQTPGSEVNQESSIFADGMPWTQAYAPEALSELAVHPKKVLQVREWLEAVFKGKSHQRLLVLKGPAGSGKTSTVYLLSKALETSIIEWQNPVTSDFTATDYVSPSSQFADFLARAGRFHRLEMVELGKEANPDKMNPKDDDFGRRLILVEDLPNVAGTSSSTLQNFRSQLLQYLASNLSSKTDPFSSGTVDPIPLVLVISESVVSASNSENNFTAHRLLGRDILHRPDTAVIEFNPVAPTIIGKALKSVLQKHTRATRRAQPVSLNILQRLAEIGDVRNAVSTLEYVYSKGILEDGQATITNNVPSKGKLKSRASKASKQQHPVSTSGGDTAMSLIALRESTLGLFHAVGKVVYNKRRDDTELRVTTATARPPPDLDPDSLLSTSGATSSVVLSALYENYILSCFPPSAPGDNEVTLTSVEGCLEALSCADILGTSSGGSFNNGRGPGVLSEGVRQDEIAFHVGARGMQYALPYPVKRQAADDKSGNGQKRYNPEVHRMFYPMDIKILRQREDMQDSLDFLVQSTHDGRLAWKLSYERGDTGEPGALEDFPKEVISQPGRMPHSGPTAGSRSEHGVTADSQISDEPGIFKYVSLASGQSARRMMLLERLPYLYTIIQACSMNGCDDASNSSILREIHRVVRFKGTGLRRDDESDDDEDTAMSLNSRQRLDVGQRAFAFSRDGFSKSGGKKTSEGAEDEIMEKLVLSDDDIVDD